MTALTRLLNVFRRDRLDEEMRAELESHLDLAEEAEVGRGSDPEAARRTARARLGSPLHYRERSVDALLLGWLDTLWQDVRYGVRQLIANPMVSMVLVVTLGVGIGAAVAIFSVVNAVLIEPLPFKAPDRMVFLWETLREENSGNASLGIFRDWTEQNTVLDRTAAVRGATYNLSDQGEPERLRGARVTSGYFEIIGIPPLAGRYFQDGDHDALQAIVSEDLWRARFDANPSLVGASIRLNGESHTVVGIAPRAFSMTDGARRATIAQLSAQVWTHFVPTPEELSNYGSHSTTIMALLKPGVAKDAAQHDLERLVRDAAKRYPAQLESRSVHVQSFRDALVGSFRGQLWLLLAAVSFVLLIGCVNVSSILLARATARRKEMGIRAALGGGRARIVRQLLTESTVYALAGGIVAIGVAWLGARVLVAMGPPELPRLRDAGLDITVLLFAFGLTLITGLLFGLAPAWRIARGDLQRALQRDSRSAAASGGRDRLRGTLVVAEIALTVLLIIGAGLFIRSAQRLQDVPLGFNPEQVLTGRVTLPAGRYEAPEAITSAFAQMVERLRAAPGTERAGAATAVPLMAGQINVGLEVEGIPRSPATMPIAEIRVATDGYLETVGIQVLNGRTLQPADMRPSAPPVIVINHHMADQIWPGQMAVGKRVSFWTSGGAPQWREVVGVVANARTFGQASPMVSEMYLPFTQAPPTSWPVFGRAMTLAVRTPGAPDVAAGALRQAVKEVDASLPLYSVLTMERAVATSQQSRVFGTVLVSSLAALGVLLAITGIYGVIVYLVTLRTPEIGLRLALGATRGTVLVMVLKQAALLAVAGIAGGVALAWGSTRLLTSLLFEVSPTDPVTFALGAVGLLVLVISSSAIPALRATRIDPVRALTGS
jgi:putative ABC transport system permease protein